MSPHKKGEGGGISKGERLTGSAAAFYGMGLKELREPFSPLQPPLFVVNKKGARCDNEKRGEMISVDL